MGFISEFNDLIHTPQWWPAGEAVNTKNQTEVERKARSRSIRGLDQYHEDQRVQFNSFSGADIVAYIHIPAQQISGADRVGPWNETEPVVGVLGTLQTISYSTFREVQPVRSLGKTYAAGYTRGPRTIAGSMVWTMLDQYVLAEALKYTYINDYDPSTILIDQIPPFNIIITFNNEYGDVASMGIYGVRMVNEGSTYSVDDLITEQTNTYVAQDIDMVHKGPPFKYHKTLSGLRTGSDILMKEARKRMSYHGSALQ